MTVPYVVKPPAAKAGQRIGLSMMYGFTAGAGIALLGPGPVPSMELVLDAVGLAAILAGIAAVGAVLFGHPWLEWGSIPWIFTGVATLSVALYFAGLTLTALFASALVGALIARWVSLSITMYAASRRRKARKGNGVRE